MGDAISQWKSRLSAITDVLREDIWFRRLDSKAGLALLLLVMTPISVLFARMDLVTSMAIAAAIIGIPLVLYALYDTAFSLMLLLVSTFATTYLMRFTAAPLGLVVDLMILVGVVSLLLHQFRKKDISFLKNALSYTILLWLFYNLIQVLNPMAASKLAWLYTVRSVALQLLVFFVGAYAFQYHRKSIDRLVLLILGLCFITAVYGLKQYFFGLSAAEIAWVTADPVRYQLFFQWNLLRIPSLCNDPTTFGILMSVFGVFCLVLATAPQPMWSRGLLGIMALFALTGTVVSGTRTAAVLIPIGAIFYIGLTMNKKVVLAGAIFLLAGTALMVKSTSIGVIYRIQSAFRPSTDSSMNVRLENQELIQPFIRSHPFGAGLGSSGSWGRRFSPNSWLANFAHDSSFVRMAVELGWIGLILYTIMHFVVIRTGIYYTIRCKDPVIKTMYAGIATVCFMFAVACYSQEAILQQPNNVIYNILLAVLVTLKNHDPAFQPNASNALN